MIKAIIFDWGGVLIDDPESGYMSYCSEHLGVTPNDLFNAMKSFKEMFEVGKISERKFWQEVCESLNVTIPSQRSLWEEAFSANYKEKQEVITLLITLRKNGYNLGLISNTELPSVRFFRKRKYRFFSVVVFSCLEGMKKPEPKIYQVALERLTVSPQEAVYVDDREVNVDGARRLGMLAIQFQDSVQLKKDLKKLSVKIQ